jgi:ATP-dependent RNA helicase DeaD
MNKFEQLGLSESLLKAILDLGFENPTEVQEKAIPLLWKRDTDMVALAQTGTGKTQLLVFQLSENDANNRNTQALILSQHANCVYRLPTNKTTQNTKRY